MEKLRKQITGLKVQMLEWCSAQRKIAIALVCLFCSIIVWVVWRSPEEQEEPTTWQTEISQSQTEQKLADQKQGAVNSKTPEQVMIDIKGAVQQPGIYQFSQKQVRIADVVKAAGGTQDKAETKAVNLAQKVGDEASIYIPFIGEEVDISVQGGSVTDGSLTSMAESKADGSNKININKADITELQKIPGIGQKRAEDIIRYREENGQFKSEADIRQVSGIGAKLSEQMLGYICLS